jgi:sugar lactone lactonase YvrE
LPGVGLLVSDTGHGAVVELAPDAETVVRRFAGFVEPQGLCLLPDGAVAVADTRAHVVRRLE